MDFKKKPGPVQINRRDFLRQSTLAGLVMAGGLPGISWAVRNGQLHIRNYQDLSTLDPAYQLSGAESVVSDAIHQSLLKFKPNGTWDTELNAAESFEQISNTRYAFRLRPGQEFTNGFGEITADDVKFSFERIIDPANNSPNLPDLGPMSHVEVHDRYSGTIVFHSPYAAFIPITGAGGTGGIVSRKAVTAVGGRFGVQPPCSSGPYQLREWRAKRKAVLEKNPLWKGPEVEFEEIHVYAMDDSKAAEMAFEAGELDCALISVESTEPFRKNMPPDSYIEVYPSGRNYWLGMNQENPALRDIRVRQAIQWAIDTTAVVEAGWFGQANPSNGPIPEGMLGHREYSLVPHAGDPDRAKALLTEAGVELPLRLSLDVAIDSLEMTSAQVIQWLLKRVGIEVHLRSHDNATFLTMGNEAYGDQWKDMQLFFQSFVGGGDPYYPLVWFTSAQVGIWNWERFSNEEFDRLSIEALATTDPAERSGMYERMQDLMEESGCYRFITNGAMPQIIRNSITPAFQPDGYPILREFRLSGQST